MAYDEVDDLGFILDEDQTSAPEISAEDWQSVYNGHLREGWMQGYRAQTNYPGLTVQSNPYTGRDSDDLIVRTRELGWEDGFLSAQAGGTLDDCPYPAP